MKEFIFDSIVDPILVIDKSHTITEVNGAFLRLIGQKRKQVIGKKCYKLIHGTNKPIEDCPSCKAFKTRKTENFEFYHPGLKKHLWISSSPVLHRGSAKIIHHIRDISELKKSEEKIKESEDKYKSVFEGATDGILAADAKAKNFVFANPKMCEITGYSEDELLKLGVADIHPKKDMPYVIDQFTKQVQGKIDIARDIPILRKNKSIVYCDVNSKPIKLGKQDLLLGFFRDMTHRNTSEQKLKQSHEELQKKVDEMEHFHKLSVDRELKMIELKKRIKELESKE